MYEKLENHYKDVQDFEFTIEQGKLFILQTRNGKRTAQAAIKIAVDMHDEGILKEEEAIMRVKPEQIEQVLTIRIHRMACPAHDKAIGALLLELNELSFHHPETGMRMIYTLA